LALKVLNCVFCADRFPRFGNYIGDAAESDEELQHDEAKPQAFDYDEAFGADEDENTAEQELMEVDGALCPLSNAMAFFSL
jgi:U5 small nuclear ribonucleoprotein component